MIGKTMAENNTQYMPLMLYYKGEKKNPYKLDDVWANYWENEFAFINQLLDDEILTEEYTRNFTFDFPTFLDEITDKTPTALKGFLYELYTHAGGSKGGFPAWLLGYVNNAIP